MSSLQGQFLIATPQLRDPNFSRTVVLLLRHDDEGALGVVVNRIAPLSIQDGWSQVSSSPCQRQDPLRLGGPCEGPLLAVHDRETPISAEVLPGVYFTSDSDALEQLVASDAGSISFFVGYAGWSANQLEGELDEGSWYTLPATNELIFATDDDLWDRLIRQVAGAKVYEALHLRHVPPDLRMN